MKTIEQHLQDLFVGKEIRVIEYFYEKEYEGVCESCIILHSDHEDDILEVRIKGVDKRIWIGLDDNVSGIEILSL